MKLELTRLKFIESPLVVGIALPSTCSVCSSSESGEGEGAFTSGDGNGDNKLLITSSIAFWRTFNLFPKFLYAWNRELGLAQDCSIEQWYEFFTEPDSASQTRIMKPIFLSEAQLPVVCIESQKNVTSHIFRRFVLCVWRHIYLSNFQHKLRNWFDNHNKNQALLKIDMHGQC